MHKPPLSTSRRLTLDPVDNARLNNLCGPLDTNLRQVESAIGVQIRNRGNHFHFIGPSRVVCLAVKAIRRMYDSSMENSLSAHQVQQLLQEVCDTEGDEPPPVSLALNAGKYTIRARSANQAAFLRGLAAHDINFAVGPAGTGKTWLAVASALATLENSQMSRLVLVRPAVEAGEHLGFLPGDLTQKVDPYLRPLFDTLYQFLGHEQTCRYLEKQVIEIAPLAFMRGRTIDESFMILDEAQNATVAQMKMFLTRIGLGSKVVVTGDITQTDLPQGKPSGLAHALEVLRGVAGVHIRFFDRGDAVRHPLVGRILDAYERHQHGPQAGRDG